jgi:hypothetical protein
VVVPAATKSRGKIRLQEAETLKQAIAAGLDADHEAT